MNIYQSNTYRKDLSWLHFNDQLRVQERHQVKEQNPAYPFFQLIQQFQVATRRNTPDITTVFHTRPYGRFIEIQSNFTRKKLHRTNQGSNFLGCIFNNRDNAQPQSKLEEKVNLSILKDEFSSRTDPSIFTSIAPVLLDRSNKTS